MSISRNILILFKVKTCNLNKVKIIIISQKRTTTLSATNHFILKSFSIVPAIPARRLLVSVSLTSGRSANRWGPVATPTTTPSPFHPLTRGGLWMFLVRVAGWFRCVRSGALRPLCELTKHPLPGTISLHLILNPLILLLLHYRGYLRKLFTRRSPSISWGRPKIDGFGRYLLHFVGKEGLIYSRKRKWENLMELLGRYRIR